MPTATAQQVPQTFEFVREEMIEAPIDIVFQSIIDELTEGQTPDGAPLPRKLEPWPDGRWFRDLGDNTGHLWGHVQVIKPPTLLEICGPLFMSYPAANHVQYRLAAEGNRMRLNFAHKSIGLFTEEHRQGMEKGWGYINNRIRELATQRANRKAKK